MIILQMIFYTVFLVAMSYYAITNLQWYSYKLERVIFHHTKSWWHIAYFLLPYALFEFTAYIGKGCVVVSAGYVVALYLWYKKLDKPLVFTGRVKRFMAISIFLGLFMTLASSGHKAVIIPIFMAYFLSAYIEKMLFNGFKKQAQKKLQEMGELRVVGITASYGKTSIKNFVAHLLKAKYNTYPTPRSVNTLGGIVKDINVDLPSDTEVYVAEMGARGEGDIAEIATLVNPQYVVVGKIGPAHIEYFKSMENIRNTKMEILQSDRLKKAFIHQSAMVKPNDNVEVFGSKEEYDMSSPLPLPKHLISDVVSTLDGISFTLDGVRYSANILGEFNAMNLAVSILIAKELGLDDEMIQKQLSSLEPVAHRLQRIDAGGKVILDDSFNGNIDGMMASFDLASTYSGRKVVITPGLVEVDDELNIQVAKRANEVFDIVVVSGELNYKIFKEYVDSSKLVKLESKDKMESMLIEHTKVGDLILFANDAPSFV
jgi:UDP-N-acetylmuramoyl-tripeptide--D-alanyl-D-alanine ligase